VVALLEIQVAPVKGRHYGANQRCATFSAELVGTNGAATGFPRPNGFPIRERDTPSGAETAPLLVDQA
jgi:hypothetical protein